MFVIFGTLRLFMVATNLFVIDNVKQLRTDGSFRILLPFFRTSWGVGVLNSAIFNSFHNRVEFSTILEGLRNFGGGGEGGLNPQTPLPRYTTITNSKLVEQCDVMIANVEETKIRFSPIKHSSGTSLSLNCYQLVSEGSSMYVHLYTHVGGPF